VRVELAALLIAGHTLVDASHEVGVTPRAVQKWRRRAYSRDPRDADCVAFEQMLQRGLLAAAEVGQTTSTSQSYEVDALGLQPLSALLAEIDTIEID
jgi:hypothetical protein